MKLELSKSVLLSALMTASTISIAEPRPTRVPAESGESIVHAVPQRENIPGLPQAEIIGGDTAEPGDYPYFGELPLSLDPAEQNAESILLL
jgi:hypothetical protein